MALAQVPLCFTMCNAVEQQPLSEEGGVEGK